MLNLSHAHSELDSVQNTAEVIRGRSHGSTPTYNTCPRPCGMCQFSVLEAAVLDSGARGEFQLVLELVRGGLRGLWLLIG